MTKLALNGGEPVRKEPFPPHPIIGEEEKKAVIEVLESGKLSSFTATGATFLGGKKVKEFEKLVADYHNIKYAVSFNSATAALHAAVIACDVNPGEEMITTPYTFTSSATCALMNNAVPIFVDIKEESYNLDPKEIEKNISPLTKAINVVHLFGQPAEMNEIMNIAKKHNLKVIEDCAQAPGAIYKNKIVGTIGDCGILSFTENKNITCGEGGMLITDNEEIAEIARLIRNHGEAVIEGQKRSYNPTILGWNYRLTEVDAAIGIEQFKKLDKLNDHRIKLSNYLKDKLKNIEGLEPQEVLEDTKHVYYVLAFNYDEDKIGINRDLFVKALNAEGISFGGGYIKPLYLTPIYHKNKPFIYKSYKGNAKYDEGTCPVAEQLYKKGLILTMLCRYPSTVKDMDDIVVAINKIIENKDKLK